MEAEERGGGSAREGGGRKRGREEADLSAEPRGNLESVPGEAGATGEVACGTRGYPAPSFRAAAGRETHLATPSWFLASVSADLPRGLAVFVVSHAHPHRLVGQALAGFAFGLGFVSASTHPRLLGLDSLLLSVRCGREFNAVSSPVLEAGGELPRPFPNSPHRFSSHSWSPRGFSPL